MAKKKITTVTTTTTTEEVEEKSQDITTRLLFLIDESGSMGERGKDRDVRGGFNTYIEKLQKDSYHYTLTAIPFNTIVKDSIFSSAPLGDTVRLTEKNYSPAGGTALLDAIGVVVSRTLEDKHVDLTHDRFTCIIMTDGEENSSKLYTKDQITQRMKELEQRGNWTFVYMGADPAAWTAASVLGFAQGNVLKFASADIGDAYTSLAASTTASSGTSNLSSTRYFGTNASGGNISSGTTDTIGEGEG
jgi:hypothetical protein